MLLAVAGGGSGLWLLLSGPWGSWQDRALPGERFALPCFFASVLSHRSKVARTHAHSLPAFLHHTSDTQLDRG